MPKHQECVPLGVLPLNSAGTCPPSPVIVDTLSGSPSTIQCIPRHSRGEEQEEENTEASPVIRRSIVLVPLLSWDVFQSQPTREVGSPFQGRLVFPRFDLPREILGSMNLHSPLGLSWALCPMRFGPQYPVSCACRVIETPLCQGDVPLRVCLDAA